MSKDKLLPCPAHINMSDNDKDEAMMNCSLRILTAEGKKTCATCKGWGAQGTAMLRKDENPEWRYCAIDLFGDDGKAGPMFRWIVTFGNAGGSKGNVHTHRDFGCVNHNPEFEKEGG